jgi:tetratricopeptide (TPR) repeat protein
MIKLLIPLLVCIATVSFEASSSPKEDLLGLQRQWSQVNYIDDPDAQVAGFEKMVEASGELVQRYPLRAEFHVWHGIAHSSLAGAKGGLGALRLAKSARASFRNAIRIDDKVLDGSAHTSLGVLYYKVPGWPIAFGSDEKAEFHLRTALSIAPHSIDANYFMAEFLYQQGDEEQARQYLLKALQAPARSGRPVADEGRRKEIKQLLKRLG